MPGVLIDLAERFGIGIGEFAILIFVLCSLSELLNVMRKLLAVYQRAIKI